VAFQNRNVEIGGWLAEVWLAPGIDIRKIGKEARKKFVLELALYLWPSNIFGLIELSPEFPLANATLVHRDGVPQLTVEDGKVFDVPGEEISAVLPRSLVKGIFHQRLTER
jgi:hypothetical protein